MSSENFFNIRDIPPYPNYQDLFNPRHHDTLTNSRIDTIVVPLGRSASHVIRPAQLAYEADTTLISMCNHESSAFEVAEELDNMKEKRPRSWYAVDFPSDYEIPDVELKAQEEIPPQARKDKGSILSQIRDAGLAIGKMTGSEGLFFQDDDLRAHLLALQFLEMALQEGNDIAGLKCADRPYMPDRSGVQHIKRGLLSFHLPDNLYEMFKGVASGQASGNSTAVNPQTVDGHFVRDIYNEDTIFTFPSVVKGKATLEGIGFYFQDIYNPFKPERLAQEEYGDLVHDGLYRCLRKNGGGVEALIKPQYWQAQIEMRRREYDMLLNAIEAKRNPKYFNQRYPPEFFEAMPKAPQGRWRNALLGGLAINETLTGENFVGYIRVWGEDRGRWNKWMSGLPKGVPTKEALSRLALDNYLTNVA